VKYVVDERCRRSRPRCRQPSADERHGHNAEQYARGCRRERQRPRQLRYHGGQTGSQDASQQCPASVGARQPASWACRQCRVKKSGGGASIVAAAARSESQVPVSRPRPGDLHLRCDPTEHAGPAGSIVPNSRSRIAAGPHCRSVRLLPPWCRWLLPFPGFGCPRSHCRPGTHRSRLSLHSSPSRSWRWLTPALPSVALLLLAGCARPRLSRIRC